MTADPRLSAVIGFAFHFAAYALASAGMVVANVVFWSGYAWAVWPILGWGIGVFSHGAKVAGYVIRGTWERPAGLSPSIGDPARLPSHRQNATVTLPVEEWSRAIRRIENLEAIVTSVEWDERGNFDLGSERTPVPSSADPDR
jgi:hypothetical protein